MEIDRHLLRQNALLGFSLGLFTIWALFVRLQFDIFDPETIDRVIRGESAALPQVETIPESLWTACLIISMYVMPWSLAVVWMISLRQICVPRAYEMTWQVIQVVLSGFFMLTLVCGIFMLYLESYAISQMEIRICIIVLDVSTHAAVILAALIVVVCHAIAARERRLPYWITRTLLILVPPVILGELLALNPNLPAVRTIWGLVMGNVSIVMQSVYFYLLANSAANNETILLNSR